MVGEEDLEAAATAWLEGSKLSVKPLNRSHPMLVYQEELYI